MTHSLFEKNLSAYALRYPDSAKFIRDLDVADYHVQRTSAGQPSLCVQTRSGKMFRIDHPENPLAEARQCVPDLGREEQLFVVMGMGLGYLLTAALERYPQSRYIVIEHDARIFRRALECLDFTAILASPNIEFLVAVRDEHMANFLHRCFVNNDNDEYLPTIQVIQNPRVVALSKEYYQKAAARVNMATKNYFDLYVGNNVLDSMQGLKHVMRNVPKLGKMSVLDPGAGFYRDRPGIVVSSGPSLDSKISWLKQVQDRAVIVCADSALRKLVENGITPFGVSCIERDDENAEYFKGFAIPPETALFAPPVIKPETFQNYPGPVCLVYRSCFPHSWLPKLSKMMGFGMSCAHFAFQVLLELGCDPVALVGQDLAYDRLSGHSHFAGVKDFAEKQYAAQERFWTPDNQGGQIQTSRDWRLFREIFEDMIVRMAQGRELLNVIEADRGAKINGTTRVDPEMFFSGLRDAGRLPPFDWQSCRDFVRQREKDYLLEFADKSRSCHAEIEHFCGQFLEMAFQKSFVAYREAKDALVKSLSEDSAYLVGMLLRPNIKRFDACARSLWTEEEFRQCLPKLIEASGAHLQQLLQVLAS